MQHPRQTQMRDDGYWIGAANLLGSVLLGYRPGNSHADRGTDRALAPEGWFLTVGILRGFPTAVGVYKRSDIPRSGSGSLPARFRFHRSYKPLRPGVMAARPKRLLARLRRCCVGAVRREIGCPARE